MFTNTFLLTSRRKTIRILRYLILYKSGNPFSFLTFRSSSSLATILLIKKASFSVSALLNRLRNLLILSMQFFDSLNDFFRVKAGFGIQSKSAFVFIKDGSVLSQRLN